MNRCSISDIFLHFCAFPIAHIFSCLQGRRGHQPHLIEGYLNRQIPPLWVVGHKLAVFSHFFVSNLLKVDCQKRMILRGEKCIDTFQKNRKSLSVQKSPEKAWKEYDVIFSFPSTWNNTMEKYSDSRIIREKWKEKK